MDPLNHWLRAIKAEGLILARTRVAGEWGFSVEQRSAAVFHFVTEGRAYLRRQGAEPLELEAGDVVVIPRGEPHEMVESTNGAAAPVEQFLASHNGIFSTARTATTLLCGAIGFDVLMLMPAIRSLPSALRLRARIGETSSPLAASLGLLGAEVENGEFGNDMLVRLLASSMFIYMLREWAAAKPDGVGDWFSALRNPQVARALACIHDAPAENWTLPRLAAAAGLSRSAFAQQFRTLVGEPPHSYLVRWRMGVAADLLKQTDMQLAEIAAKVGYKSEFSFSRAFREARGVPPIQARRELRRDMSAAAGAPSLFG